MSGFCVILALYPGHTNNRGMRLVLNLLGFFTNHMFYLFSEKSTVFHWQERFKKRHPLNLIVSALLIFAGTNVHRFCDDT